LCKENPGILQVPSSLPKKGSNEYMMHSPKNLPLIAAIIRTWEAYNKQNQNSAPGNFLIKKKMQTVQHQMSMQRATLVQ
jgi:hypothetical protein